MKNQLVVMEVEAARIAFSAIKTNFNTPRFAAEARMTINRAGRWRHLHLAAACFILAVLGLVGAGFAPPGIWPSIWGVTAGALALLSLFWAFEYDAHQLTRIISDLELRTKQNEDSVQAVG